MPDEQGRPGVIGMSFDVSDREQAAEQLQLSAQVFQHSGEGIVITDTNGKIIALNRAFERITGYTAQEAVGHTPALLASGRQDGNFTAICGRRCTSRALVGEIWNRRKSGEVYPEWLSITAIRNAGGDSSLYRYFYRHDQPQGKRTRHLSTGQLRQPDAAAQSPPVQQSAPGWRWLPNWRTAARRPCCLSIWMASSWSTTSPGHMPVMRSWWRWRGGYTAVWTTTPRWHGWKATIF